MFDARKLLDQVMGTAETYAGKQNVDKVKGMVASNPGLVQAAGVGLAAMLLGSKSGRKLAGNAATMGGLALVGGLAYKAFQNWQEGQKGNPPPVAGHIEPPPANTAFSASNAEQERATTFLVAMISAAKSDGHIDADEQKRIFAQISEQAVGSEAKAFLMEEMMAPLDISRVTRLSTSQERAVEIYAASCMAIELDHPDERAYLDRLAEALRLDPGLTEHIEKAVEEERAAAM